jgi:hypothetical protein
MEFPMVPLVNVPPLWPLVLPLVIPGVTPVEVGEPPEGGAVVEPPVEPPVPVCANAKALDRVSADASAIVASFIIASCFGFVAVPMRSRCFRSRSATHP